MIIVDKIEVFKTEGIGEQHIFYDGYFEAIKLLLKKLTPDQRTELFSEYCRACGCDDPKCQCWNDE